MKSATQFVVFSILVWPIAALAEASPWQVWEYCLHQWCRSGDSAKVLFLANLPLEAITVVETAGNNLQRYLPALKEAEVRVMHKCTSVRHSLNVQVIGSDAVSVDGFECGDHDIPTCKDMIVQIMTGAGALIRGWLKSMLAAG